MASVAVPEPPSFTNWKTNKICQIPVANWNKKNYYFLYFNKFNDLKVYVDNGKKGRLRNTFYDHNLFFLYNYLTFLSSTLLSFLNLLDPGVPPVWGTASGSVWPETEALYELAVQKYLSQGYGSGSTWIRIHFPFQVPDPHIERGSGSRRGKLKNQQKNARKLVPVIVVILFINVM